ncbi:hypothetical protein [Clostridium beijerinckii]|uniref:hypothetical protein n=1 Tax=Clostridium beijerinckii TaxID=1520 RepID=UPI0009BE2F65|nr:hypothetical protein [Clostridium beijerinckii]
MIDKNKIFSNLEYIESMNQHGASPNLDEYWEEIVDMLSEDIEETRKFLNEECNEHQIWCMAGYYEDISYNFQSSKFIDILEELQKKYPDMDIEQDIQWAKDAIED